MYRRHKDHAEAVRRYSTGRLRNNLDPKVPLATGHLLIHLSGLRQNTLMKRSMALDGCLYLACCPKPMVGLRARQSFPSRRLLDGLALGFPPMVRLNELLNLDRSLLWESPFDCIHLDCFHHLRLPFQCPLNPTVWSKVSFE